MSVIIPLRSLTTSLFITIINASIELACLSAVLVIIAANECRKLHRGEAVNIRTHCFVVRFGTVAAMIMFITLEILVSVNSEVGFRVSTKLQDCVTTREGMISGEDTPASEAITMRCMNVSSDNVYSFRNGNYSKVDGSVQCEKDVVFNYTGGDIIPLEPILGSSIKCSFGICAAAKARGNILLLSESFPEGSGEIENSGASFLRTNLSFDPQPILEDIASKLAELYQVPITDELRLRRLSLLRAIDSRCEFIDEQKQVTEISTWIAVLILIVWVLSIVVILTALFVRRSVFYDMHRTWDWATKTYNVPDRDFGTEFFIKSRLEGDIRRIFVVNSAEDDEELNELEGAVEWKPHRPHD